MDGRQKAIILVLSIASPTLVYLVVGLIPRLVSTQQSAAAEAPTSVYPDASQTPAPRDMLTPLLAEQNKRQEEDWGRDPFTVYPGFQPCDVIDPKAAPARPSGPPPGPKDLHLSTVFKRDGRWLAVIDGALAGEGDQVRNSYTVEEVTRNTMTLSAGGFTFHYELGRAEPVVKERPDKP